MRSEKALFALFLVAFTAIACGGGDPTWIGNGSGGAQDRSTAGKGTADGGDAGPTYRDPKAGDAGCTTPNQMCTSGMTTTCTDVSSDHENCGACGKACLSGGPAGDSMCVAGNCGCTGALVDYCDGVGCQDVRSDMNNCGACGVVCDPNLYESCTDGNCVLKEE